MKIAMTGVSGEMGREALRQTLELPAVQWVRVLLTNKKRNDKLARKLQKQYGERIRFVRGTIAEKENCRALVEGADYVVHMAAVIPPASDAHPEESEMCNRGGVCSTC